MHTRVISIDFVRDTCDARPSTRLRRNAALEERAAASIARAKAVVEGSDGAATRAPAVSGVSSGSFRAFGGDAGAGSGYGQIVSGGAAADAVSLTPDQLAAEAASAAYDAPPTPPQDSPAPSRPVAAAARPSARDNGAPTAAASSMSSRPPSKSAAATAKGAATDGAKDAKALKDDGEDQDHAGRLARARIRALQDELAAQARELREAHSRLKDRDAELKSLLQEKLAGAKATKAMQVALEKEKRAAAEAKVQAEARERECADLRRETERAARGAKAGEQEMKARDVRLNRALEEVERYRHMLEAAQDAGKWGDIGARQEVGTGEGGLMPSSFHHTKTRSSQRSIHELNARRGFNVSNLEPYYTK